MYNSKVEEKEMIYKDKRYDNNHRDVSKDKEGDEGGRGSINRIKDEGIIEGETNGDEEIFKGERKRNKNNNDESRKEEFKKNPAKRNVNLQNNLKDQDNDKKISKGEKDENKNSDDKSSKE